MRSRSSVNRVLRNVARIITDEYGLRLVFGGKTAYVNHHTIYLPTIPVEVPDPLLNAIRGWIDHECAHVLYTQRSRDFQGELGPLFPLLNGVEDARIEYRLASHYPGACANICQAREYSDLEASKSPWKESQPLTITDIGVAIYTRAVGAPDFSSVHPYAYSLTQYCPDEIAAIRKCRSTKAAKALTLSIWEKLKPHLPDNTGSEKQEPPANEGEEEENEKEKEQSPSSSLANSLPKEEEEEEETSPQCPSASNGEGGNGGNGGGRNHSVNIPIGDGDPMKALAESISSALSGLRSKEEYTVYSTEGDIVESVKATSCSSAKWPELLEEAERYSSGLRRQLERLLLSKAKTSWRGDLSRGRLDPRSLHRLATQTSTRIFRKRTLSEGRDTAVSLLVDCSSSMSGYMSTCHSLSLLLMKMLSSLPVEVLGFSTNEEAGFPVPGSDTPVPDRESLAKALGMSYEELMETWTRISPLWYGIFKEFDEPWKTAAPRIPEMSARELTPLGEALLFAGERLLQRPELHKVLLCLTDGKPIVGNNDESTFAHSVKSAAYLEKRGLTLIGIGIGEPCVREIFSRSAIVSDISELPGKFLDELSRAISHQSEAH